ncbi:MAG: BPL-N domain-containing protein, partial [Thermodesulfovibrionales bacterium]
MKSSKLKPAAFLWNESFLWGLMAYKALKANGLSFELIRAEDVKKGRLKNYAMLFVPGGWASNKLKPLGNAGIAEIKKFVRNGGNYLGFCGGAGLATLDGIGLLIFKRKPTKERVPSFSGRIHLNSNKHPMWNRLPNPPPPPFSKGGRGGIFHAWWPSQFLIEDSGLKILATYGNALPDSFSSDLNVGDVEMNSNWSELEDIYGINLNPKRLKNEPAVIEGTFGKGRVILSLIHFDTPDDENGAMVLRNLWEYLTENSDELRVMSYEFLPPQPPLAKGGSKG